MTYDTHAYTPLGANVKQYKNCCEMFQTSRSTIAIVKPINPKIEFDPI